MPSITGASILVSSVTSAHVPARDHAAACHDRLRRSRGRRRAHHRPRRHRRQLEAALRHDRPGRVWRGGQGRRLWLRHRARGAGAQEGRLPDVFRGRYRGRPARARVRAGCGHLRAQRADAEHGGSLRRGQSAAGDQQHHRTRRMGHLRRLQQLAWRRGAACRHRHEPARPDAGGSGRHRAAPADRGPRLQAPDQPLRLRRDARPSR